MRKGILLAGGYGTRLSPVSKLINKHFIPIFNKPLIYYPISILLLSGVKKLLIICNENDIDRYKKFLGDGSRFGITIEYKIQFNPEGIPQGLVLAESFIGKSDIVLILGDNLFYGQGLTKSLEQAYKNKKNSIFLYDVINPESFGVAHLKKKKIIGFYEKPKNNKFGNSAITGLYFLENNSIQIAKKLKKSKRGETEIIKLLSKLNKKNKINYFRLGRGVAWLDTGTFDGILNASQFVQSLEKRQNNQIACLEEIAMMKGYIDKKDIKKSIKFYGNCEYSNYLKTLT